MAQRRIRRRPLAGRKFVWVRHQVASTVTGDAVASDLLSQFETDYGAQLIGCTITRIRGYMYAFPALDVVSVLDAFRFGARVTSGNLDISTTVPDQSPWTDENADWMLWQPFARATQDTGFQVGPDTLMARMVDVKSQRRLEELGERLIMFQGGSPGAPTIQWAYGWDLSIGVKLP